jgi:hypothetical protein
VLLVLLYAIRYSIPALKSFPLASIDDIFYVTHATEFSLGGPDSQVIRNTPLPPYSPNDRWTSVFFYLD